MVSLQFINKMSQQCGVLFLLALLVTEGFTARIIGGQEVPRFSIKYQVSLQSSRGHYCGGTLVHPQWVVSAAHCWIPNILMKVVLSEHNLEVTEGFEQVFNVSMIYINKFNYWTFDNDIMLIKLSQPAQLNANIQPAVLPDTTAPPLSSDTCTVSGWGVTQIYNSYLSPVLRAVDVQVISNCRRYYYWGMVTSNMLCAGSRLGGKDSCQGDSGGPLVCNGRFEGIVSWGIGCADPYFPGVYTRVRNYVTWMNEIIQNNSGVSEK